MGGRPIYLMNNISLNENLDRIPDAILDELVKTASPLFVAKGFDRTTTRELSKAQGWSKGRLYQYFNLTKDLMPVLFNFFVERDQEHNVPAWCQFFYGS